MIRIMNAKQRFLDNYDREHERTMRVLRAFPPDKLDLKPSPQSKSARDLAWIFFLERALITRIWHDELAKGIPPGPSMHKAPPQDWNELMADVEKACQDFRALYEATSDDDLNGVVHFLTGPKQMGEYRRNDVAWFFLFDEVHHRGQLSVYLRMAGGKVPSIYGPSADEPWM
jgi:uncharacterized damage-inducible protein DinB